MNLRKQVVYYKIVGEDMCSLYQKGSLGRKYISGKWAYPCKEALKLGYGLCVFESLEDVFKFVQSAIRIIPHQIWTCQIGKILPLKPYKCGTTLTALAVNIVEPMKTAYIDLWPKGTIMTDRVKLLEKIGGKYES
jgi:hypothetical protein